MPAPARRIFALALRSIGADRTLVSRLTERVHLSYIDFNGHMNYASYLEVMELGRWDWAFRSGAGRALVRERCRPVVVAVDIRYRRELRARARFTLDTRLVRLDKRVALFRQVIHVGEHLHAQAEVRALLLRRGKVADAATVARVLDPFQAEALGLDGSRVAVAAAS